ncbi:MAG: MFS transporter, partial [Rhodospirillales bacterium]|nr:MFS transporter [Rhodospirillales bacterium]
MLWAYAGSVFTYFLILWRMRVIEKPTGKSETGGMIGEIVESFRYALAHKGIFYLLALLCATGLLIRPVMELLPGFSEEVFGSGAEGLSMLMSATGAGAVVSGLWLSRRGRTRGLTSLVSFSLMATSVSLLGFTMSGNIWLAIFCLSLVGAFILIGNVGSQTLIQNAVDSGIRGCVLSLFIIISWGFPALGGLAEGWLASIFGLGPVIGWGAVLAFAGWLGARPFLARARQALEAE